MRVQAIRTGDANKVCVEVMSKDGRYTAENLYNLAASMVPAPRLAAQTKYGDRLRGYLTDDIAVIIAQDPVLRCRRLGSDHSGNGHAEGRRSGHPQPA